MTLRIKVCGLKDPDNAKELSGTGIDFAGFIFFAGSIRFVGRHPDKSLFSNVGSGIRKTGVFVDEEPSRILEIAKYASLDTIQLHGSEPAIHCEMLKKAGFQIIKSFGVGEDFDPGVTNLYADACDYFLFDKKHETYGGSGKKFDWNLLKDHQFRRPFFLSGGIGHEDTGFENIIANEQFFALDINSRFETSPGVKDISRVRSFINKVKGEQL